MTCSDMNSMVETFESGSECTDFVDMYASLCCQYPPVFLPTNPPVSTGGVQEEGVYRCIDTDGWVDAYGYGCDWYETNDSPDCPSGNAAKDNCCYCGKTPTRISQSTVSKPKLEPVPIAKSGGVAFSGFGVFAIVFTFWEVYAVGFLW